MLRFVFVYDARFADALYTVADQKVTHFLQILEILKNVKNLI